MTTYVTGMGRITLRWTTDGLTHKCRAYCKQPGLVGVNWMIGSRAGTPLAINWTLAADDMATSVGNILQAGQAFGQAELEVFDGLLWVSKAFHSITAAGQSGGYKAAAQATTVIRDTGLMKLKLVVLEGNQGPPTHYTATNQGDQYVQAFIKEWLNGAYTLTYAPYLWAASHRELFINDAGAYVGFTTSLNRRVRRRRGLV